MLTLLEKRLYSAEDNFFSAITGNDLALRHFENQWLELKADVNSAKQHNQAGPQVVELAYATASRVKNLAQSFLEINASYDEIQQEFQKELQDMFARASLSDTPSELGSYLISEETAIATDRTRLSDSRPSPSPPYIAPAYKWLLKNIHNPYPTKEVKKSISDRTGASLKLIDEWFMSVRRRMGWTALARKHFTKSRSETVDAAYRALVKDDPLRPIPADVQGEFVAMEDRAKNLYSDKFRKSALAGKLSVAVRNMTAEDKKRREDEIIRAEEEEARRWQNDKAARRIKRAKEREAQKKARRAQLSYPSPARSPDPSLPLPLTDESDDDTTLPEPLAGRKRRMSSSDTESDNEASSNSQRKRSKTGGTSQVYPETPNISLPSPQASSENLNNGFDAATPSQSLTTTALPSLATPIVASAQRKRRRSDADAQPAYKHPRGYIGPRLHAVSDPLPMSSSLDTEFDSWFQNSFDVPQAATIDDLDSSRVEVELFKGWPTNFEECDSPLSSEATTPFSGQELELPESELRSVTPEAFGLHLLSRPSMDDQAKINSIDIPNIFEETTFDDWAYPQSDKPAEVVAVEQAPAPVMPILPSDNVDLPHLDSLFSNFNIPVQSYPEYDTNSLLSTTSVQSPMLDPNINWDMVYYLLSNEVASPGGDLTHEYSTSDPLALLFNTDVPPVLAPQNDEVSKAEKRRKLAELKQAQRRLEAELSE